MTEQQLPKDPKNIKKFLIRNGAKYEIFKKEKSNFHCIISKLDDLGHGFQIRVEGETEKQAFKLAMKKGIKLVNEYLKQKEFIKENYPA